VLMRVNIMILTNYLIDVVHINFLFCAHIISIKIYNIYTLKNTPILI
jgi:hypothetical protein